MAFVLDPTDPDIRAQVQHLTLDLIGRTLARQGGDPATQIHAMRKTVKKLRGLLRLVRPVMRDFKAENAALRDAGRSIADLRAAEVMLKTAELLGRDLTEDQRAQLVAPFARLRDAAVDPAVLDAQVRAFALALGQVADRAPGWKIKGKGFDALAPGLIRTWSEAQTALQTARANPAPDHLHDWRKRVKDHWYQAQLLAPVWPAMTAPHVALVDDLGETLGQLNDLADFAPRAAALAIGPGLHEALTARIAARRTALQDHAFAMGRPLFAEPPDAMAARWRAWWEIAAKP